jgi:hypothetical protein
VLRRAGRGGGAELTEREEAGESKMTAGDTMVRARGGGRGGTGVLVGSAGGTKGAD